MPADLGEEADQPIRRALRADLDDGFVLLFETYQRMMFSTALRVSGSWADAEDLTAEAFLRAYWALAGYPVERIDTLRPRAWLVTILLNGWRNRQRSAIRHPSTALDEAQEPTDPHADVERVVAGRETSVELGELLAQLPTPQRVAVVLRHVGELSIAEIAEALGCAQGTAKSHISRGLARLRLLQSECDSTSNGGIR